MQLTTAIPGARVEEIVRAIESILEWHLVENNLGSFRWQRCSHGGGFAQYRLEFCSPQRILWFEVRRTSCILLSLGENVIDGKSRFHLRWQIKSIPPGRELCELIVRETALEIANVLDESSRMQSRRHEGKAVMSG